MSTPTALRQRIEALCRWLLDEGHITPTGVQQLANVLDDEGVIIGQPPRPVSGEQALLVGMALGEMMKAGLDVDAEYLPGLHDRARDYAASVVLTLHGGGLVEPGPRVRLSVEGPV